MSNLEVVFSYSGKAKAPDGTFKEAEFIPRPSQILDNGKVLFPETFQPDLDDDNKPIARVQYYLKKDAYIALLKKEICGLERSLEYYKSNAYRYLLKSKTVRRRISRRIKIAEHMKKKKQVELQKLENREWSPRPFSSETHQKNTNLKYLQRSIEKQIELGQKPYRFVSPVAKKSRSRSLSIPPENYLKAS